MTKHVTMLYLEWHERKLDADRADSVRQHLDECDSCCRYFELMDAILIPAPDSEALHLEPDPFLPSRIKAQASPARLRTTRVRDWSVAAFGAALAIVIGFSLGKGLVDSRTSTGSDDLFSEYYEAFSQETVGDRWREAYSPLEEQER